MVFEGRIEKGMVVVDGPVPLPDGTRVRVEAMFAPSFWHSHSLDELAEQQGVAVPAAVDDLLGGWPADERDDKFDEALVRWREQELERGR